ncbi:hypothetical protein DH2020_004852 [Rehmannia glutinosa]|uniref:Protein kinase domain-containing protein n=1 Tax=Rehmannia glutinosa TaxID=99300 RepID=A0ABR0XQM1_REHGL
MISNPSNISSPSSPLIPDQSLFVPITCSCNTVNSSITISYAALNYTILSGDTFLVSTQKFQNLTTYQSVEVVNPSFQPTRLNVGDVIVFPIFCRCPNSSQLRNRVNYLVSYVFQPSDRLSDVASREGLIKRKGEKYRDEEKHRVGKGGTNGFLKAEERSLMADVSGCLDKYKVFGIEDLKIATDGFDDKWLIQGSVYKGCIDGEWFAIKKMKWNAYEELKILQKVNHGNLVRLEGFCIDSEEANCYLVYEYVENGSLHSWLHDNKPQKLSWKTRLRIAIDVANGLQYIHEHTRPKVVHKDIKSSNILLDSNMRAKIANFGLAKSGCNAITMHIVGTQGYIAPEYLSDGVVSTKMDVFSFGVVLLELVSGREAMDEQGNVLWASAIGILDGREEKKSKKLREWMDECLVNETESAMSVVGVAIACLNRDPARRPSMVEIVYALSKSDDLFFDVSEDGLSPRQVVAR